MEKNKIARDILDSYVTSDWPMGVPFSDIIKAMEEYAKQSRQADVSVSLPLTLKSVEKLKRGDVFLWRSGMTGRYEIHTFHSDAGYGAKTFTNWNEKNESSEIVNYSGICGVLEGNDR